MLQDTPSFLAYWRNARSRTVRVRSALTPEDLEWAPAPGVFSFGDLFRHRLGLERFMYAETVQGRFFQALEIKSGTPMNTDKS